MKKLKVYQIGGMEQADNLGAGWREELTPFLEALGLEVLNPCEFEKKQLGDLRPNRLPDFYTNGLTGEKIKPIYWHDLRNAQEPRLYNRFLKYMRRIINYDMNLVDREVDVAIVYWDKATAQGAGSHAEITAAFRKNIPVYCVAVCDMPGWIKACCSEIFLDFSALRESLTEDFGELK